MCDNSIYLLLPNLVLRPNFGKVAAFRNNSTVLAEYLVIEMCALPLSLVHQIGGCAGQDRFDLLEKRAKCGPDANTEDETAD